MCFLTTSGLYPITVRDMIKSMPMPAPPKVGPPWIEVLFFLESLRNVSFEKIQGSRFQILLALWMPPPPT